MTLNKFLRVHLFPANGHSIEFGLLHKMYLSATDDESPSRHKVAFSRALHAAGFRTAVTNQNRTRVVNVSLNPLAKPSKPLRLRTGKATSRKRIAK